MRGMTKLRFAIAAALAAAAITAPAARADEVQVGGYVLDSGAVVGVSGTDSYGTGALEAASYGTGDLDGQSYGTGGASGS